MDEKIKSLKVPQPGEWLSPKQAMCLAISEAWRGAGWTSPNPNVGCVILNSAGRFLSAGFHRKFGGPHAEVEALRSLSSDLLEGAQVFVTLEPCAHEGKTPSCAKALAKLPLRRVVYGLQDPNPLVSGQGAQILREAGIDVAVYSDGGDKSLDDDLEEVAEHFLWNFRRKKPFVTLKIASSLDGKIALANGVSQWITGPTAREFGHWLRATHDVTLVGVGTIRNDNPSLDIRHPDFPDKRNRVVVLGGSLEEKKSEDWRFKKSHRSDEVIWLEKGSLAGGLSDLGSRLWEQGVRSILVEGGARVASSFLKAGLINRLHLLQAPLVLGGSGLGWTEELEVSSMEERLNFRNPRWRPLGVDQHFTGVL